MKNSFIVRYNSLISKLHITIPSYPSSDLIKKGKTSHIAYHAMELTNILAFTKVFEKKIIASDNPLFSPFKQYSSLLDRRKKIQDDIQILNEELKKNNFSQEFSSQKGAQQYADYITNLVDPVKLLAHFFANTAAALFDSANVSRNLPKKMGNNPRNKIGVSYYNFDSMNHDIFRDILSELDSESSTETKLNAEQEETFLAEIKVAFNMLFPVLADQNKWCEENFEIFLDLDTQLAKHIKREPLISETPLQRNWDNANTSAKPSSFSCTFWTAAAGIAVAAAAVVAVTASTCAP